MQFVTVGKMKVTTLNLQGMINWEVRQLAILLYLQTEKPDIILFQEVVFLPDISPYNQVQTLNQTLGYEYEHCSVTRLQPSAQYTTFREGLGMLSKYPVIKSDVLILKKEAGDEHNRIIQLLDIEVKGQIVKFANIHFSLTHKKDYATIHLKETLGILKDRGEARIIAGDFNRDHLEDLSELWGDDYTLSTDTSYISFPSEATRIDYFLVPKVYSLTDLSLSDDSLSDHRALTVEIA